MELPGVHHLTAESQISLQLLLNQQTAGPEHVNTEVPSSPNHGGSINVEQAVFLGLGGLACLGILAYAMWDRAVGDKHRARKVDNPGTPLQIVDNQE